MRPGQDLVAAGYIALHGTAAIARIREAELQARFSSRFVDHCKNIELQYGVFKTPFVKEPSLCVPERAFPPAVPDAAFLADTPAGPAKIPGISGSAEDETASFWRKAGAEEWEAAGEGGVMAALWNFFELHGLGFDLELRSLPIRQETVEVCELFDVNPYRLHSRGCVLLTAGNGADVVRRLKKAGIHAAVVGKTAAGPGKRLHNREVHSFLNRPGPDELYKITGAGKEP